MQKFLGASCRADANDDTQVDVLDLISVILDWDTNGNVHGGDVTGDGTVDILDLLEVITNWGPCP